MSRRRFLCEGLVLLAVGALAAQPASAAQDDAAALDLKIQQLKAEALSIGTDTERTVDEVSIPADKRLTVDLSADPGIVVRSVKLSIDGVPMSRDYAVGDGYTLARGGFDRLMQASVGSGSHRLQAEVSANFSGAKPADAPVSSSITQTFDVDHGPLVLELAAENNAKKGLNLSMRLWSPRP